MKTNVNILYFGLAGAVVSVGFCIAVSYIRRALDRRKQSAINAANGFDVQSSEKPFIKELCNN